MDLLKELSLFKQALKEYKNLLGKLSFNQPLPDAYQNKRESLLLDSSRLIPQIKRLTGKDESLVIYEFAKPRSINMWEMGLRNEYDYRTAEAVDACIDNTTIAIGKLKSDIEMGIMDKEGNVIEKPIKKQSSAKEIRKQLSGTPAELAPHIKRVAEEFTYRGLKYCALEELNKSSQVSKQLRIICGSYFGPKISFIGGDDEEEEEIPRNSADDIGVITLQSLLGNKTLFIARAIPSSFDSDGSYFDSFLARLSLEFKNLGFEKSRVKKIWQWLKFHKILSIIVTVIIVGVTLLGTNWTTVQENFIKFLEFFR